MGSPYLVKLTVVHPASHTEIGAIISRKSGKYTARYEKESKKDSRQEEIEK
jgi:hypothetical protein